MSFFPRFRIRKGTGTTFVRPRVSLIEGTNITLTVADDAADDEIDVTIDAAAGSGAPTDADYLVGTANGSLSNEIVVGTTPGGELGGTWDTPTVDATHSGSAHHTEAHTHASHTGIGTDDHHAQSHGNADHTTTGTPGDSALADAAAQGASASVARLDHQHGRESFASSGVATTPARSDHFHHISILGTWTKVDLGTGTSQISMDLGDDALNDNNIIMPFSGHLRGVGIRLSSARTAGIATFRVYLAGVVAKTLLIDATTTNDLTATYALADATWAAGERIVVTVQTDGSFTPATTDAFVTLFGSFDQAS
jgi:hypothetical protein